MLLVLYVYDLIVPLNTSFCNTGLLKARTLSRPFRRADWEHIYSGLPYGGKNLLVNMPFAAEKMVAKPGVRVVESSADPRTQLQHLKYQISDIICMFLSLPARGKGPGTPAASALVDMILAALEPEIPLIIWAAAGTLKTTILAPDTDSGPVSALRRPADLRRYLEEYFATRYPQANQDAAAKERTSQDRMVEERLRRLGYID